MIFTGEAEWHDWVMEHGRSRVLQIDRMSLLPPGLREALEFETFSLSPDPTVPPSIAIANDDGSVDVKVNASLSSEETMEAGAIRRVIRTGRSVEHSLFALPQMFWGRGNARRMLRSAVQLYDQLEIEEITLQAEGLGKYIWAAAGFDFADDETRQAVNVAMRLFAEELELFEEPLPEFRHAWEVLAIDVDDDGQPIYVDAGKLQEALENRGEIRLLGGFRPGKMVPSKALLLYSRYDRWDGVLDLSFASESRRHLDSYL